MERDLNLLFGVFAVQLRKVTPAQLMAAAGAWASDRSKDLPARLVEDGALAQNDVDFLQRLVTEAIDAHDGDVAATLHTVGGESTVYASFGPSIALTASGGVETLETPEKYLDAGQVPGVQETPGRYTHVSEYGRGGMGRVLLVHDAFLGREVALKELLPGPTPKDPASPSTPVRKYMRFFSRFLQEARITGQLEHPSIVPVYELGHRDDGTLYYTMKLVRGKTLRQAIRECGDVQHRLNLLPHFVDLCQAIAYAHSRGIIHRDLKPDNIMVGEFGETVVLDWGLAKAKDQEDVHADGLAETIRLMNLGDVDSAEKTQYGEVMGTPAYMSPEQAKGQIDQVNERSDVYSLGAVLYELLSGQPPFSGRTTADVLRQVLQYAPARLDKKKVPPELSAICATAMAKRPVMRYESASALAEEVQRFQSGAIVQAYSYGFAFHLKRFVVRHKAVLATAAAGAIVLMLAAGLFLQRERTLRLQAQHSEKVAILERARAQTQWERAEKNFRRARDTLNDLNAVVSDSEILNQPGFQPARRDLLGSILKYYKDFVAERSTDLRLQVDLADAYFRLAGVTREIGTSSEAVKAYEEAIATLQTLQFPGAELGEGKRMLSACFNNLGDTFRSMENWSGARTAFEDGISIAEELVAGTDPLSEDWESLARLLSNMAFLEADFGRLEEARNLHERATGIRQTLASKNPSSVKNKAELARSQGNLGMTHARLGDSQQAVEALNETIRFWEQLIMTEPDLPEYKIALATDCNNLALLSISRSEFERSEELLSRAQQLLADLTLENPSVWQYKDELAKSLHNMARLKTDTNDLEAAEEFHGKAIDIYKELASSQPDIPAYQTNLSTGFMSRAQVRLRRDKTQEALGDFSKAAEVLEALITEQPDSGETRQSLANVCNELAWALLTEVDDDSVSPDEALHFAERAAELTERLDPYVLDTLALAYFRVGRTSAAADTQRLAIELLKKRSDDQLLPFLVNQFEERMAEYTEAATESAIPGKPPDTEGRK